MGVDQGKDDDDDPTWQTHVLRSAMFGTARLRGPGGPYTPTLWGADEAL